MGEPPLHVGCACALMSWATWRAGQVVARVVAHKTAQVAAPEVAAREAMAVREVAAAQPVAQS